MWYRRSIASIVLFSFLFACSSRNNFEDANGPRGIVEYSNSDLSFSTIFFDDDMYAGYEREMTDAIRQTEGGLSIVRWTKKDSVHCALIGETGYEVSYAIKRPLKSGEVYKCGNTEFKTLSCTSAGDGQPCENGLVRGRHYPPQTEDPSLFREFLMYVDTCRGVISITEKETGEEKFELARALELRGRLGILADDKTEKCKKEINRVDELYKSIVR